MGRMVDGKWVGKFPKHQWFDRRGKPVTDTKQYTEGGIRRGMTADELEEEKKKRGRAGQTAIETLGGD